MFVRIPQGYEYCDYSLRRCQGAQKWPVQGEWKKHVTRRKASGAFHGSSYDLLEEMTGRKEQKGHSPQAGDHLP
eukprot:578012-Pleurochrysis_carterae.AAC.1